MWNELKIDEEVSHEVVFSKTLVLTHLEHGQGGGGRICGKCLFLQEI